MSLRAILTAALLLAPTAALAAPGVCCAIGSWVGSAMKEKEGIKDRISEREYRDRLKSLLKNDFNTQLEPLKSLKTATKKRRELKKKA